MNTQTKINALCAQKREPNTGWPSVIMNTLRKRYPDAMQGNDAGPVRVGHFRTQTNSVTVVSGAVDPDQRHTLSVLDWSGQLIKQFAFYDEPGGKPYAMDMDDNLIDVYTVTDVVSEIVLRALNSKFVEVTVEA